MAIWKTDFLLEYLHHSETAWGFEKKGSKRVIRRRNEGLEQRLILGMKPPLMKYVNSIGGEGNHPHVWAKKRFPSALWNEMLKLGYVEAHDG